MGLQGFISRFCDLGVWRCCVCCLNVFFISIRRSNVFFCFFYVTENFGIWFFGTSLLYINLVHRFVTEKTETSRVLRRVYHYCTLHKTYGCMWYVLHFSGFGIYSKPETVRQPRSRTSGGFIEIPYIFTSFSISLKIWNFSDTVF